MHSIKRQWLYLPVFISLFIAGLSSSNSPYDKVIGAQLNSTESVRALVPQRLPRRSNDDYPPNITASSVIIVDPKTNSVLWSKEADQRRPIASLTKLVTALVVLESTDLYQKLRVDELTPIGSQMGLKSGEIVTIETLLWGLLVNSGNDAAMVLDEWYSEQGISLVKLLNYKAQSLNLKNTHFVNPSGLHHSDHYSTARDLTVLAKLFIDKPLLVQMASTPELVRTSVEDSQGNISRWYHLTNTNSLLGEVEGVLGVKTGFTAEAGECQVSYIKRGEQELIVVVLGSQDRGEDSRLLIEWSYDNWSW